MRFHILDVDHGFCAYLAADNNHLILFDCGHSIDPEFRPSGYLYDLGYRSVQRFFVTSFDQDHIGDLPSLRRLLGIDILTCNTSITPEQLRREKRKGGPITPEMEELLSLIGKSDSPATHHPEFPPRVSWQTFHARYGRDFDDTNNLSVVTFLNCDGTIFLLPGNLEEAGWRFHLRNEAFKGQLRQVNLTSSYSPTARRSKPRGRPPKTTPRTQSASTTMVRHDTRSQPATTETSGGIYDVRMDIQPRSFARTGIVDLRGTASAR
jgi:hypothetical protein